MQPTVYKSKFGIALPLVFALTIGLIIYFESLDLISALLIIGAIIGFMLLLYKTTEYIITGNWLMVRSAYLVYEKIDIGSIRKIAETRNPLSSPALSLDRLEVFYNKFDSIIISPKDNQAFINQMIALNPGVIVEMKSRKN